MMANILIIDDARLIREKLSAILSKQGHTIIGTAENGQEGLVQFKKLKPDLVTLDITMPVMDGIETLKEIMKVDPQACVVICSAMGQQRLVVEAIEIGAKDFIIKPFDDKRIIETIHLILSAH